MNKMNDIVVKFCEVQRFRQKWLWIGKAYNVSDNRDVQLKLSTGKGLLIGSQRPEEFAQAIQEGMRE